jgi:hypothetical protein
VLGDGFLLVEGEGHGRAKGEVERKRALPFSSTAFPNERFGAKGCRGWNRRGV